MTRLVLATLVVLALAGPGWGACPPVKRSAAVVRQFRKTHPCPTTGKTRGRCVGWVVDHVVPLCLGVEAGGDDKVTNMAWMEYRASLIKDRWERALCRQQPRPCPHAGD